MSRTGCVICTHKKADEINARLINKPRSGESFQTIADHFGLSKTTLMSHFNGNPDKNESGHISDLLLNSKDAKEALKADNTFAEYQAAKARIEALQTKTYDLLGKAEATTDHRSCIGYIREARAQEGELREQRKLLAELEGKLATQPTINLMICAEWIELKSTIITILKEHPAALEAVRNAIK